MNQSDDFIKNILACPQCKARLEFKGEKMSCPQCRGPYFVYEGIPLFINKKNISPDLELTIRKWNKEYEKLSKKDIEKEKNDYNRIYLVSEIKQIKHFIAPEHKIFLEIGSGPAFLGLEMAKAGFKVICLDISLKALLIAKALFAKEKVKGYFVSADILNMPFQNESIDFINGSGVIEHFKDTEGAIKELYRVLKKGGVALNTIPYLSLATLYRQLWGNIPEVPILKKSAEFFHIKLLGAKHMKFGYEKSFSQSKIKRIFFQTGFKEVKTGLFDCYLPLSFAPGQTLKKALRGLSKYKLFWPMIYIYAKK